MKYSDSHKPAEPVRKSIGVTSAERYLAQLAEKTFLSLWSYPGLYREEAKQDGSIRRKEVCDLLVVFENHVLIFSDKDCNFPTSGSPETRWGRWFRRAIRKSADQLWGAERWVRKNPDNLYLDRHCNNPLPIPVPRPAKAQFHLILVAHGVSELISKAFGGTGSLFIDMRLEGAEAHNVPFTVGDLNPNQSFVHILDDDSLARVMGARDTVVDFVSYLEKRETFLRSKPRIHAVGEEALLAMYLTNVNREKEHDFVLPVAKDEKPTDVYLDDSHWADFESNPQRLAQIEADGISYLWDRLIERFNQHAMDGTQYFTPKGGLRDHELIVRHMAREPRWKRRYLASALMDIVRTNPKDKRRTFAVQATAHDPAYVYLLLPQLPGMSEERYRNARMGLLTASCKVAKLMFPTARAIIGIGTESGPPDMLRRSEDCVYFDASEWSDQDHREAVQLQKKLEIWTKPRMGRGRISEYPTPPKPRYPRNLSRNALCPCGSGLKYKKCCLR